MEHRYLATLGGDYREAGIGVAVQHQRIWLFSCHDFIRLFNHSRNGLGRVLADRLKKMVRLAYVQVIEEKLIQFVIVVLSAMHQNVLGILIEFGNHPAHFDEFRARTNNGHDFKHLTLP